MSVDLFTELQEAQRPEEDICIWCLSGTGPVSCPECRAKRGQGLIHRISHRVRSRTTGKWGTCSNQYPRVGALRPVLWDRHKQWVLAEPADLIHSITGTSIPGITPGGAYFTEPYRGPYPVDKNPLQDD